jgi:hypothetical protein
MPPIFSIAACRATRENTYSHSQQHAENSFTPTQEPRMSDYDVICKLRELDADERNEAALSDAADYLRNQFIDAFEGGTPTIDTPLFTYHTKSELHQCMSSSTDCDKMLAMLVMRASKSQDPAMRLLAQAWIAAAGREHGETHAAAWVEGHTP